MDEELPKLKEAIVNHGYSEDVAREVQAIIEPFVGYGFNKSHAAAYAFIAYQCAYLKTHYPLEFFIANMTIEEKMEEMAKLIEDARKNGLEVLPPDINISEGSFSYASDTEIVYGLNGIKSLKTKAVEKILATRPYDSLDEFYIKTGGTGIDKTSLTALAYSGAFDNFEEFKESNRAEINFQLMLRYNHKFEDAMEEMEKFDNIRKLELENHYLGTYLTGHPLEGIAQETDWDEAILEEGSINTFAYITSIKEIVTKKGDSMAFIGLSFLDYESDIVCFPDLWEKTTKLGKNRPEVPFSKLLKEGMLVKVNAYFQNRDKLSLIAKNFKILQKYNKRFEETFKEIEKEHGVHIEPVQKIEMPKMFIDDF